MNEQLRRAAVAFLTSSTVLILFACVMPEAHADLDLKRTCRFVLHDEMLEFEEQELRVDLAEAVFVAAEEIFVLVDGLWKNDAIQRMLFLGFKHDRDIAELDLERQKSLLDRQAAVVEQYRLQCRPTKQEGAAGRTRRIDEAFQHYLAADCAVSDVSVRIGKVDTEFQVEFLESVRDLRASAVATRQQVVFAQRDLEMARMRLQRATKRVETCKANASP